MFDIFFNYKLKKLKKICRKLFAICLSLIDIFQYVIIQRIALLHSILYYFLLHTISFNSNQIHFISVQKIVCALFTIKNENCKITLYAHRIQLTH